MMSTWPSYARPVPPAGDSHLPAVVIGNLPLAMKPWKDIQTHLLYSRSQMELHDIFMII